MFDLCLRIWDRITVTEKRVLRLHLTCSIFHMGLHVPAAVSMWCTLSLTPLKREYRQNATLRRCL